MMKKITLMLFILSLQITSNYIIITAAPVLPNQFSLPPVSKQEQKRIDAWLTKNNLNPFGDPANIKFYTGGTPLFHEATGIYIDRYNYIKRKFRDSPWNQVEQQAASSSDFSTLKPALAKNT